MRNKYVFRFYVPVDYISFMDVGQSRSNFKENFPDFINFADLRSDTLINFIFNFILF